MDDGQIEYRNRTICSFMSVNNYATSIGLNKKISCKFKVNRLFPIENNLLFSVLSCYGLAKINEIEIGRLIPPSFFKLSSDIPDFTIILTNDDIGLIEELRKNNDITISFELKTLCSFDKNIFFELNSLSELDMNLYTKIAKSRWLEYFLPEWDFFSYNEQMVYYKNIKSVSKLRDILIKARQNYYSSDYGGTLVSCYKALEALPKEIGYKDIKSMFTELISKGNEIKKYEYLNNIFKSTKEFMHIARHIEGGQGKDMFKDILVTKEDAKLALIYSEILIDYMIVHKHLK